MILKYIQKIADEADWINIIEDTIAMVGIIYIAIFLGFPQWLAIIAGMFGYRLGNGSKP